MKAKCILRLEYFSDDNDDIRKELDQLESVGWQVVIDNDMEWSTIRQQWKTIITLEKVRE
jgi:hypothetical protein